LLGRKGFITRVLPKMAIFNGRKFHPSRHDTKALETSWREKMFGAQGDLLPIWNNRDRAS
ncbi:metal-dependent hydrolase, partial [Acinetobacter baumannii]